MRQKHFRIRPVGEAEEVHVCVCFPDQVTEVSPSVICSHGFTVDGTESHRMFFEMAERLVLEGIVCVLFDYRGCGYSSGAFRDLRPSREIADLLGVYEFVLGDQEVPAHSLGLLGQSHGSYIAILAAPRMERLKAMCLWGASVSPLERYKQNFGRLSRHEGMIQLEKGFQLSPQFLEDMASQNAIEAAQHISCHVAFIHAGNDESVPVGEGRQAYEAVRVAKSFELIEGANHSYKGQPALQERAFQATVQWFRNHLFKE